MSQIWLLEHKYSKTMTANFAIQMLLSDWWASSKYCVDAGDRGMSLALGSKELEREGSHLLLRIMSNIKFVNHLFLECLTNTFRMGLTTGCLDLMTEELLQLTFDKYYSFYIILFYVNPFTLQCHKFGISMLTLLFKSLAHSVLVQRINKWIHEFFICMEKKNKDDATFKYISLEILKNLISNAPNHFYWIWK